MYDNSLLVIEAADELARSGRPQLAIERVYARLDCMLR